MCLSRLSAFVLEGYRPVCCCHAVDFLQLMFFLGSVTCLQPALSAPAAAASRTTSLPEDSGCFLQTGAVRKQWDKPHDDQPRDVVTFRGATEEDLQKIARWASAIAATGGLEKGAGGNERKASPESQVSMRGMGHKRRLRGARLAGSTFGGLPLTSASTGSSRPGHSEGAHLADEVYLDPDTGFGSSERDSGGGVSTCHSSRERGRQRHGGDAADPVAHWHMCY